MYNFKAPFLVLGLQCYHSGVLGLLYEIVWFNNTELSSVSTQAQNHKHSCCSVAKSSLTLSDPMDCSTPGLPVHHQLLELAQTHVH